MRFHQFARAAAHRVALTLAFGTQFVGLSALQAQSMPTYWRLADPDAKMLAGFDVKAILNSQAAAAYTGQFQQAANGAFPADLTQALSGALGTGAGLAMGDFLRQVDRVFLSLGEIPQSSSKAKGTIALVGEFDLPALRKFMGEQGGVKSSYRGVEVWQSAKASDNAMIAIASPQVLAVGDRASVRKAVSQFAVGNGSLMASALYQRAAALAQTNDIWVAGELPQAAPAKGADMMSQMMGSLQDFDLGIRMKSGLALDLNLYANSAQSASGLAAAMQGMVQLAANQAQDTQATNALSHLKMGTDGERIQMSAAWTQAELATAMNDILNERFNPKTKLQGRAKNAAPAASHADGKNPSGLVAAETPKPQGPLKVKIYNPDGGVKELELVRD